MYNFTNLGERKAPHITLTTQKNDCVNLYIIKNDIAMKQYIFFNYDIWQMIVNKSVCLEDTHMSL